MPYKQSSVIEPRGFQIQEAFANACAGKINRFAPN